MDKNDSSAKLNMPVSQNTDRGKSLLRQLLELIRFSHTVFALPFALLACVWAVAVPFAEDLHTSSEAGLTGSATLLRSLGPSEPTAGQLALRVLGVLLCMITARSAAMAFNRLVDVQFDAGNPRTAGRHLVTGTLGSGQVWVFFAVMSLLFFASCFLFLPNWLPLAAAIPVLLWICGYSLAKRFTWAVHLWLGVALALSPICAWVAMRGEMLLVSPGDIGPAIGLALSIVCWVAGFDIIYACQDTEFDRAAGLHSIPARLGVRGALWVAAIFHALMILVLATLPPLFPQLSLGYVYWIGLALVASLVIRQHAIVRPEDLGRINEAFFQINAVLSFCLSIVAAVDAIWR